MTPAAFREALAALGHTQASFARLLAAHGHPARDVARSVRRWAEIGPPGEVVVILALLRIAHEGLASRSGPFDKMAAGLKEAIGIAKGETEPAAMHVPARKNA
jgi:hypothetical protein